MTILFAASELDPLARTGGLGDVIEAMPAALRERGHEVSVASPTIARSGRPRGLGCARLESRSRVQ